MGILLMFESTVFVFCSCISFMFLSYEPLETGSACLNRLQVKGCCCCWSMLRSLHLLFQSWSTDDCNKISLFFTVFSHRMKCRSQHMNDTRLIPRCWQENKEWCKANRKEPVGVWKIDKFPLKSGEQMWPTDKAIKEFYLWLQLDVLLSV